MKTKFVLLLTVLLLSAAMGFAQTSGTCGENLTWTLSDGTLTVSGTGEMTNYSDPSTAPWYSVREDEGVIYDMYILLFSPVRGNLPMNFLPGNFTPP
jgi:hypothetical protein